MKKSTLIAIGICALFALVIIAVTLVVMPDLVGNQQNAADSNTDQSKGIQMAGNVAWAALIRWSIRMARRLPSSLLTAPIG